MRHLAPLATLAVFLFPALAHAQDGAAASPNGYIAIGIGLTMGLAVLGGTLAQGRATGSVLEGICRNPASAKASFTPMILGLALIESLVIFAFLIAFMLLGKFA